MGTKYTYEQIASNLELWKEYVDPDANMTDEEFAELTIDERIAMQVECFGTETDEE